MAVGALKNANHLEYPAGEEAGDTHDYRAEHGPADTGPGEASFIEANDGQTAAAAEETAEPGHENEERAVDQE
mgnify:CR=1 FL=1